MPSFAKMRLAVTNSSRIKSSLLITLSLALLLARTWFVAAARRGTQLSICARSEEHTSELQSLTNLVCRLLLEKKNTKQLLTIQLEPSSNTPYITLLYSSHLT